MALGCFQHRSMPGSDPLTNTSHTSNVSWTMSVTQQAVLFPIKCKPIVPVHPAPLRATGELLGRDLGDTIFVHNTPVVLSGI